ncbi:MAG: mechanosensitive ion channel family protein [Candidatus Marinimicrobia bacterium]|jgi:small-conductance mechanosensitive channel|nr:mechanosensitive ion channel family protein [Candidatus Neomarinimicrobiota bacterium]MBT3502421.1 mechanosensitive ion channel family protein [Candidatus Neomarinimicrobiota bacterium]MBT3838781.1 mechanosensitive ion channel family protein [Candidatus Neomarinimicrobiota bacterium]MBT3999645.1 mechanosensitive ion channel family protein [Candidatus Neomarinimicrobiota bacterium]MBT4578790.1 mechanosensitive ion channel family protein [Candidatus Neomarinimicrobiota bacterium]
MIDTIISTIQTNQFLTTWLVPILIVFTAITLGMVFKQVIHSRLKKAAANSEWEGDDIILDAVESQIILWFFWAGLSIALRGVEIVEPIGLYISKFLIIILISSITHAAAKLIVGLLNIWSKKQGGGFPSTTMFTNFVWVTVYIVGLLIILDALEISIAPMLTALGIGGLAVSLALKDTLTDVFAGLHILLSKKVQPGDFVSLDSGEMGYIQNITWRNTKMLERTNNIIQIPNTKLSKAIIKNYDSGDPSFSVKVPIGVGYGSDLEKVEQVVMEVAKDVHAALEQTNKNSTPAFKFRGFGDSSIDCIVYFRGKKYGDQNPIIHEFVKRLHKRFNEEGIEIPFPMRTVIQRTES